MRNFIRFLFSGNDVHKIAVSAVDDVVFDTVPTLYAEAVGSMKISFRMSDPGPAQVRPLLPGRLLFIADPTAAGVLPDFTEVDFTSAAYSSWKTVGTLRVLSVLDKTTLGGLDAIAPNLPVKPNRIWYGPIQLPEEFLFDTLRNKLKKNTLRTGAGKTISAKHADWARHAIAQFLAGTYEPNIELSDDEASDDVIRCIMPTVYIPPGGDVTLIVTTALAQNPQDSRDSEFDDSTLPLSRDDPRHPRNGLIPAREVYRELRSHMVPEVSSESLRNTILAAWPAAPRFFPIIFTRTWERIPNCSRHFPLQTARITVGGTILHEQQLPAHGVVYFRQMPMNSQQLPPIADISLTGGYMTWLVGGGSSWREKGRTVPITIDFGLTPQAHLAARLPMNRAIFSDVTRIHGQPMSCTYHSIRRTVRALVDNRIAGGRLNFGVNATSPDTRRIIQRAFAGTSASAALVAANAPNPAGNPNLSLTLIPVLEAFFPGKAPQYAFPGAPANPIQLSFGRAIHDLWQSRSDEFQDSRQRANFSDQHIGRGGPGAVVMAGLASFHIDPAQTPGETGDAYFDRIVAQMLVGLQPGTVLQFWFASSDFEDLKTRSVPADGISSIGHSPVLVRYVEANDGSVIGIRILDQHGEEDEMVMGTPGNRRIPWGGVRPEIWIAANWDE